MTFDSVHVGLIVGIAGKLFIILADSMPPPAANCGYWTRWAYDAIQRLASNSLRVGATSEAKHE